MPFDVIPSKGISEAPFNNLSWIYLELTCRRRDDLFSRSAASVTLILNAVMNLWRVLLANLNLVLKTYKRGCFVDNH